MKTTHFKNTKISYTDQGKGTAVVLLHGFLENQSMWEAFVPELTKKYRIITIDLLGHGETECLGYVHTMEDQADMVHHVLHKLKIRKDREVILHFAPYPIQLILGKKDPVLNYDDNLEQIEGTQVQLTTFEDGHMSHFENQAELLAVLSGFLKKV